MLTYTEAQLFLRAGDDMRFATWPAGDFVRMVVGTPAPVDGFEITQYVPAQVELDTADWRRA